jgi:hypothetical protein
MTARAIALTAAVAVGACSAPPRGVLAGTPAPPPEFEQACAVADAKCSRCHPIERVLVSRGMGVHKWEFYVEQMRLKPSSGISLTDADIIFRCLRFVEEACSDCKQGRS